jgi:PTS system nitrogen regulatory IIA component
MKLIDVLSKKSIVVGAKLEDKAEALLQVAQTAKKSDILKNVSEEQILQALQERESLGSTGFGNGIAIPHCRIKSVTDFVVGIITVADGVDFDALDSEPVNLIIFIIAPDAEPNKHLKILSAISQTLLIPGIVKEILTETTSEAVYESFLRHTHAEIDTTKQTAKCLFNVFVQDENVFKDILEKLTGIETSSLFVTSTESVAAYLTKVPLFADFWRDKPRNFNKVIIAVVDKGLTNETIRRIETITGNLNECSGVMVIVQDIAYVAGLL